MSDIIERLRGPSPSIMAMRDGANEIQLLRHETARLHRALAERDAALAVVANGMIDGHRILTCRRCKALSIAGKEITHKDWCFLANLPASARALIEVLTAVKELRQAQRDYMANRGNDAYGKIVAIKAAAVDNALAKLNGEKNEETPQHED